MNMIRLFNICYLFTHTYTKVDDRHRCLFTIFHAFFHFPCFLKLLILFQNATPLANSVFCLAPMFSPAGKETMEID